MDKQLTRMANSKSAERLRAALKQLNLSQAKFAKEIDMDPITVSRWATGTAQPSGILWAYIRLRTKIKELTDVENRG